MEAARGRAEYMRELAAAATAAWKDPRLSWTLEAWMPLLPAKPRVIVCLRSPAEVVASTLRYYGLAGDEPERSVLHTWRAQYERLLEIIKEYRLDAICVEYRELHADPKRVARRLSRFVGRKLDDAGVRRELRHHDAAVPKELRGLYARVKALGMPKRAIRSAGGRSVSAPAHS